MPRSLNPSTLSRGGGLAASKSVEASSFVHPTQGLDSLIAHVVDPRRAHLAQTIAIVDAGGYFASDDVEGALQEVASSASSTGQNGVVQGGTYVAGVFPAITVATPTIVRVNGTDRTVSGTAINLTPAATNWLYVHGATGVVSILVGAAPPTITSPENVLLARIVTDGVGILSSADARWFVKNLDRKLPLTVRSSGTEADRNSEASFESIDAALLYLSNFGASGVMRTYTLVIKGALTIAAPLVIPVNGVTLQGEDGCVLSTGAVLTPMIDVSGRSGIRIRDIAFSAANAGATAIAAPSGGAISDVVVERCRFVSGASAWATAIDFDVAGPQSQVTVRDCEVTATTFGIRFREPTNCRIVDTVVTESGGAGTVGYHLGRVGGAVGTTADSIARNVLTKGFATGAFLRGTRMKAVECAVVDADTGIHVGPDSDDVVVSGSSVLLDATNGLVGMTVDGDNIRITGCRVRNARAGGAYAAEVPIGIDVVTGADSVSVVGCQVEDFLNTVTPGGIGLRFAGTSVGSVVDGCTFDTVDVGVSAVGATARLRLVGCTVVDARVGMSLQGDTLVGDAKIRLDTTRAMVGIDLFADNVQIANSRIQNPRGAGTYLGGDIPTGIRLNTVSKISVSNVDILGFYNSVGSTGSLVATTGNSSDIVVSGGVMETAWVGISIGGGGNRLITGVTVKDCQTLVAMGGASNVVTGCTLVASTATGVVGVLATGTDTVVTGCVLTNSRAVYAGEDPVGISLNGENAKVSGCLLRGWRNLAGTLGSACSVLTGASQVTFEGNTVENCWSGFLTVTAAAASDVLVADNTFRDVDRDPLLISNSDQVRVTGNTVINGGSTNGIQVANSADVEVCNNRILGGASLPVGIVLSGTDTAANRMRRFSVSNNIVASCTADGILLSGYVQNGVVSGNTVDNFLPAAQYDPTATACIRLASGGATDLIKHVEVVGNICLRSRSGIILTGIDASNLSVSVSIRGNTIHHCAVGSAGSTVSFGISAAWTRDLQVLDNNLFRIGKGINDADVEGDPTAGANVWPLGIGITNSTVTKVDGNTIGDPSPAGATYSRGISFANTDTVLAFDARDVVISNNDIAARDALPAVGFGIMVASGQDAGASGNTTSIFGLAITDNVVRRADFQAILVACGGGCVMQQVSVSGNTISVCVDAALGRGIWVDVVSGTAFADGILRELNIVGNTIGNTGDSGILVESNDGCSLTTVTIRDNQLADTGDHAIEIVGDLTQAAFDVFVVDGNTIVGSTNEAIHFQVTDFSPTKLSFSGNSIYGADGGAALGQGIHIATVRSAVDVNDITGLAVSDNRIHTNAAAAIFVNLDGALHEAVFSGNVVESNSSSPLAITCDPVNTVAVETYVEDIVVSGNTLVGGTAVTLSVDHGQKLRNVSFVGNVRRTSSTHGLTVSIANATVGTGLAVSGLTISGNTFEDITTEAVRLLVGDAVTQIDDCANISISDNHFTLCNTGGVSDEVVHVRGLALISDLAVSGNTFMSCGAVASEDTGNIQVELGVNGPGAAGRNVAVTGNSFENCTGVGIFVGPHAAAGTKSVFDLRVDGNNVYSQSNDAIRLILDDYTDVNGVSVSHNLIQSISDGGGLLSDTGITFLGPSTGGVVVNQLSVQGNTIRSTGNNNVSGGIQVIIQEEAADLSIDGNVVALATGNIAGIYVAVDGLWLNGSVSGNVVSSPTVDGIHLKMTGTDVGTTGIRGVTVANNSVSGAGNDGIVTTSAIVGSTPVLDNFVVSGNTVDDSDRYGIFVAGEVLTSVSVSGNTVRLTGAADGIRVTSDADMLGVTVNDNTVSSAFQHGIAVFSGDDTYGLTVSGNTVYLWSLDAGAVSYGGVYVVLGAADTDFAQSVVVSGNALISTATFANGYWFDITAAVTGMVISDNTVDMGNAASTRSFYFDAGTGSQSGLNITGNTLRRAVAGNGVNFTGTFAPTNSVCAMNVERTGTGASAGNWGTGGATTFTNPFVTSIVTPNQD